MTKDCPEWLLGIDIDGHVLGEGSVLMACSLAGRTSEPYDGWIAANDFGPETAP